LDFIATTTCNPQKENQNDNFICTHGYLFTVAEEETVTCGLCGAENPKGIVYCRECGVELEKEPTEDEGEEDLVVGLLDVPKEEDEAKEGAEAPKEKEDFDELLDSLLIEEEKKEEVGEFECPLCSAPVPADAKSCPQCGADFVEAEEEAVPEPEVPLEEEVAVEPEVPPTVEEVEEPVPAKPKKPKVKIKEKVKPPEVEVSEAEIPKTHIYEGRIIDFTILGTIIALIAIFFGFQMFYFSNLTSVTLGVFFAVMFIGIFIVYFFFRISTSAVSQGDKLVKQGLYAEAIQMYDRGIRLGINPASAWTSKGVAYKRIGEYQNALKCHNIALKLNPKNEIAWCNKGDILFKLKRLNEALEAYDQAIELKPKYAIAWNNKGATLAIAGRYEEAKECHKKAIQLRPKYVAAWLNQGEVLVRLGRRKEAEICLRRAKALGAA